MSFVHPWILLALPILGLLIWKHLQKNQSAAIKFPNTDTLSKLENPKHRWIQKSPFILRLITGTLCILALAQPQVLDSNRKSYSQGINMMMILDLSKSMSETDLKPSRVEAAKKTMREFIQKRRHDKIGLLVFGKEAFTSCPLTTDRSLLDTFVTRFTIGTVNPYGTAIGLAIATAIPRFKEDAQSNVIILLTDGINNAGNIEPLTATQLATQKGIRIYTIGVGADQAYNKEILEQIAIQSKGKFFEASNTDALNEIYNEINKLETHKITHKHLLKQVDLYPKLLWAALWCLVLELLLTQLIIIRIP